MRNLTVAPTHKNSAVCLLVLLLLLASHVYAQDDAIRLDTETERAATVQTLTQTALMQKQEALNMAKSLNWPVRAETLDGVTYELIKVVNGTPITMSPIM